MNRSTFVLLTTFTMVFTSAMAGCSDRDAENESVSPAASQQAGESNSRELTGTGDNDARDNDGGQMDHGDQGHEHEAGGHDDNAAHEEQEGMAHEHGEHAGMQGASHWNAPAEAATLINPVAADTASIKRGRALYAMNCISCHGASGRGDGPISAALDPKPVDLVVMAPMHPAGDFFWKIENGRGPMPAWKNTLDENQIWDLVNYIKSLGEAESPDADGDGHDHAH